MKQKAFHLRPIDPLKGYTLRPSHAGLLSVPSILYVVILKLQHETVIFLLEVILPSEPRTGPRLVVKNLFLICTLQSWLRLSFLYKFVAISFFFLN